MQIELAELLYKARLTALGIVIKTDNAERLRQKLYAIRKEIPDLHCLAFVISPENGEDLWIIKQPEVEQDAPG